MCDDGAMLSRTVIVAMLTAGALAGGGVARPATSPPSGAVAEFAVPAERLADLEAAGLGHLLPAGYPDQPDGVPWPTDEWPVGRMPEGVDVAALQDVLATAFAPDAGIDAVVAVQGGRLVLERYRDGWDPDAPHVSWSMAKSITQAMLGILVAEGRVDPWAAAPVPEWSNPDDPRNAITIDQMLHMRSGLEWQEEYAGESDVTTMLFGDGRADRGAYAASKLLAHEPGAVWYYSTGTSMMLARVIADQVGYGTEGTDWAQQALFGPLGITSVDHDLDGIGVMSGGSHIDMTAEDFARFGYLYLRGGEWDGTQIVPEAWVDYGRLPMGNDEASFDYGAHWWVMGSADRTPTSFAALGFGGQSITVVPEYDLVVVVLAAVDDDSSDVAARAVVDAFAGVAS